MGLFRPHAYSEEPFEILAPLAKGGMAEVFIARQHLDDGSSRLVAVKKILPALASQKKNLEMFLDEARITARFDHPNVVRVFEHGQVDGSHFIVMEYLEGESLGFAVARSVKSGHNLQPELAAGILAQVCDALHYAHALADDQGLPMNIIHRDISPQNIIVLFSGRVKLLDFGIARADMRLHQTRTGVTKGKYAYMSPEQCLGRKLDGRSDLFSLGIVMWEVLSGRRLFKRKGEMDTMKAVVESKVPPVRKYQPQVPSALQAIALRALDKEPNKRFSSAGEMGAALRRYLERAGSAAGEGEIAGFLAQVLADRIQIKRDLLLKLDDYAGQPEALSVLKPDSDAVMPSSSRAGGTPSSGEGVAMDSSAEDSGGDGLAGDWSEEAEASDAYAAFPRSFDNIDHGEEDEESERRETTQATAVERRPAQSDPAAGSAASALEQETSWPDDLSAPASSEPSGAAGDLDPVDAGGGTDLGPGPTAPDSDWSRDYPPEDDDDPDTQVQRLSAIQRAEPEAPPERAPARPRPSRADEARARKAARIEARRSQQAEADPSGKRNLPLALLVGGATLAATLLLIFMWPAADDSQPKGPMAIAGPAGPADAKPAPGPGDSKPPPANQTGGRSSPIGMVQIDSTPAGCVVLLDGKKLEKRTPVSGLVVSAKVKHRLSVLCPDKLPATRDFKAEPGESVGLVFRLDGSERQPDPVPETKDPPKNGAVAEAGTKKRRPVRTAAVATQGSLRLNTTPWTEVFLGDRSLGITPLLGTKLKPGVYELKLVNKELGVATSLQVTIRPGRTTKVFKRLN